MSTNITLYEHNFYQWTQQQAALLRNRIWQELDWHGLAEEIETLGRSERHALESRFEVLVTHLLKWCYQPTYREHSRSWRLTILEQRRRLLRLLQTSPSLLLAEIINETYPHARRMAWEETALLPTTFPDACPWTVAQVLDAEFWPEETPSP